MKALSVVLGVTAIACSGTSADIPGATGDPGTSDVGALAADAFAVLRNTGPGDRDHGGGSRALRRAIAAAAARLADLQADAVGDNAHNGLVDADPDDGGWDFIVAPSATAHSAAASEPNLYGETALAAWAAVETGIAGNRALVTALEAGIAMQRNPDIDSPPDFAFGVLLADLADNPGFADVARQHYDAKRAAFGGAAGLGTFIRDGRHARNQDGLIPYDLGWLTVSAAALDAAFPGAGYDRDADTYATIVVDDLTSATPRFDLGDPAEGFYVIGLAWSQVAAARRAATAVFQRARSALLAQQLADGAWPTSAREPADDLQSTGQALQTLALTGASTGQTRRAVRNASRFLLGAQAPSGGWPDALQNELPLVDADIALGLLLSRTDLGDDGLVPDGPSAPAAHARSHAALSASPLP